MKDISATEAARNFSDLLDAVEHKKESFVVRRGGKAVARIAPASTSSGADVKKLLRKMTLDGEWEAELLALRRRLNPEERDWTD